MNDPDPLLRRLADADPAPPGRVEGASRSPTAEHLLSTLTDGPGEGRERRRLLRPWSAVAAVLLVAVVAAALLLRASGEAPATASELLRRTAIVAAGREPAPAGRYLYRRTEVLRRSSGGEPGEVWTVLMPEVEEVWVAADGSGRIRATFGDIRFPGPRDRDRWSAADPAPVGESSDHVFAAGELSVANDVSELATRADTLLPELRSRAEGNLPTNVGVFGQIAELLAAGDASPELRAALFRVAAGLPGIELLGETTDPIGRAGVAVQMTYSDGGSAVSKIMIFDETTSQLLAQQEVLRERAPWIDADPGTRLGYTVYVETGRTDSLTLTPRGRSVPLP